MTTDRPEVTVAAVVIAPSILSHSVRRRIFFYLGALAVLLAFGGPFGGLIDIPISFFLKNRLHLKAHEVAEFRLVSSIPVYLSFVFGFIRDTWNPFGMRDRGFMVMFGIVSAGLYVFFSFTPITYVILLIAVVLLTTSGLFVASALSGLVAMIGQQHAMSGQISAVWNIFASIPTVAALLIGGTLSDLLEGRNADQAARILFLVGAAIMAAVIVFAAWKPKSVFDNVRTERKSAAHLLKDLKRLVLHWPVYPALLICLLLELRSWLRHASSVLPSEYPARRGRSVGSVERHRRCLRHSDFHAIRLAMPKASLENSAPVGDRRCCSADDTVALHSLGARCVDRSRAHWSHGRCSQRRLFGPAHSVLPSGPTRDNADDGRQPVLDRHTIWQCARDKPL